MDVILIQFLLAIILFFLINWIGKHSYSIGYMEISIFVKNEEAPALNFLIRVLTPVVYIVIVSAILYYLGLDKYVRNIFLVNIYYIFFRLIFNLLTNRGLLLNWNRQFLYWGAIIVISYLTYDKIIRIKSNILPDFTTIANELWIIILVFIFQITNSISLATEGTEKRKQNYLRSRYKHFNVLYGQKIKDITQNEFLETITFAILIYEDFNRPKLVRIIENIKFRITKKTHTLGVMQVKSNKLLTDDESLILGTKKIVDSYNEYLKLDSTDLDDYTSWSAIYHVISDYNMGDSYVYEVAELAETIKSEFYRSKIKTSKNEPKITKL